MAQKANYPITPSPNYPITPLPDYPLRFPIYMDSHATTPLDRRVLDALLPFFSEQFGNASSRNHAFGWTAKKAVERAREQVGTLIGARFRDIVFTSGATESNNLAIKGVAASALPGRTHIVTVCTEHRAVLDPCRQLERQGFEVTYLAVDSEGLIDLEAVRDAVTARTLLVSVMAGNNEIGVMQPLGEIGKIARDLGALFHCDAAQAAGTSPCDVDELGVDLMSLSAHKMYGPKGVGALYVRKKNPPIRLEPLLHGGGHERGYRSGTLNVPGIVGFGAAAEICAAEMTKERACVAALRDRLWDGLRRNLDGVQPNGSMTARLPQNLNVRIEGVPGDVLFMALDDVAVSSGAACTTATAEPSHVLRALGLKDELARASIRFGLGRFSTEQEVDYVISKITKVVTSLRKKHSMG